MNEHYQHWRLQIDAEQIAWLTLDRQDSKVNTLNAAVLNELAAVIQQLQQTPPRAVVLCSGKTTGFIAGADIEQFAALSDAAAATAMIRQGQIIFADFEKLPCPTIALIHGYCLGGGFELALACRYRIASTDAKTKIGLPEVLLGIHPGWGGTVRLPKLIGAPNALTAILTGKHYDAKAAFKMGMVDSIVPERHLQRAARLCALQPPKPHQPRAMLQWLTHDWLRWLFARYLRRKTHQKVRPEHYPAPFAIIDHFEKYGVSGEAAYIAEAESIGHLMVDDRSRNLVRVFFLQERLKSAAKGLAFKPKSVHVIGAGVMGGDIAAWCALKGLRVTLQDQDAERIGAAVKRAYQLFQKRAKTTRAIQAAMDNLIPDPTGAGIANADVIIEAVFEDLAVKQQLFTEVEKQAKPTAILATNTSCLPLEAIAKQMRDPSRLIGIHYFNPVPMMPLVEVVTTVQQDKSIVDAATAFVRKIDKLPVTVKSAPGFLVNRVLMPYLLEAVYLFMEGIPLPAIDEAAKRFGMPMGPLELADTVGLDVCLAVADHLSAGNRETLPAILRQKVAEGHLGKKTGRGFYEYVKGKPVIEDVPPEYTPPTDLTDRLILRLINETFACVKKGIVADADIADAAVIFGTGFAPFRGGPLHYAQACGLASFQERLSSLAQRYGDRFLEKV